ncbi:sushi, von Willebrand factor type A, EGF and pentraxin domain-containing protein 1-like isoform X2 [Lineus longissimus]|uniref:sushi, von Willebrand factor type A, EGF and pentraxin domain-containing protein 1-like isoform X2 n=1 Tax=Lineus longissimus TaxID=88925 RepID=UPI00315C4F91
MRVKIKMVSSGYCQRVLSLIRILLLFVPIVLGDSLTTASPKDCSTPLIANGKVTRDETVLHSGKPISSATFVDVSCNTGFSLDGDVVLMCQVDGKWKGRIPFCVAADVMIGNQKCKVPDIPHSRIKYLHSTVNAGDELSPGKEISVVCSPGYKREGDKFLRCLNNESWSHAIPECRSSFLTVAPPTACKLPIIPNGAYYIAETGGDYGGDYGGGDYGGGDYGGGDYGDSGDSLPTTQTQSKSQASDIRELALGGSIEVKCDTDRGYEIVGSKHVNCELDGRLSNVPFCLADSGVGTVSKCYVPQIINGRIKLLHDDITQGTPVDVNKTITIGCDILMDREGEELLTCLENGTWNHPSPVCKQKTIDPFSPCFLPEIENGGYEIPTTSSPAMTDSAGGSDYGDYGGDGGQTDYGGTAPTGPPKLHRGLNMTVRCSPGYKLIGSPIVRCYENVTLSAIPFCEKVRCTVQTLPNGTIKMGNTVAPSEVNFNVTLAASCDEGFHLIGADRLTCGEKQEFDEDFPKCLNGTAFCTIPTIENGRSSLLRPGLKLASLDTVKIVCNKGYLVDTTTNVIKCGVSGDWLPKVSKCLIARCKVVSVIPDGQVLVNGSLAPSTIQYGDNITVICHDGFRLLGNRDIQCGEDGTLSAKFPHCEPENKGSCRVSRMEDNHTMIDTNLNFISSGQSVKMSCVLGFIRNIKGDKLNCDDGTWRQTKPVCVRDNKCTLPKIKHGKITVKINRRDRSDTILVNDTAYLECDIGYIRHGKEEIQCVAVEKYKDPLPSCTAGTTRFCFAPKVGYGELVGVDGTVISSREYLSPNTRITVKCPVSEEIVKGHSEAECLKNGTWNKELYKCKKAPESTSNIEHQSSTGDHTLYAWIGLPVGVLIIGLVIVAVVLYRRRKQQKFETAPIMYNTMDNIVYLTSAEAKNINGSNGQSNLGMNPDDGYMPPYMRRQKGHSRPFDDMVTRRSHVRDSVAADYENENDRPVSVITYKPAYSKPPSNRNTNPTDDDTEVRINE